MGIRAYTLLVAGLVATGLDARSLQFTLSVDNRSDVPRKDEPVVVKLDRLKRLDFTVKGADIRQKGGESLPYQLDDMDRDNKADELVFLVDMDAESRQTYTVRLDDTEDGRRFTPRVYADMQLDDKKGKHPYITSIEAPGDSYLYSDLYHHGAAFESELTAYRIYFDHRQNIDIYGKRLRRLELADTHFYTTPEQTAQDYGCDVLWAGNSIGCGSFKGWDGKNTVNIEPVKTRGQKIIARGPLRTVVKVWDYGWDSLDMTQYYIMYAGHRDCHVHIEFDRPLTTQTFTTGVQKVGQTPEGFAGADGTAASWGGDYPEMGKKEQFPPETVGLAVYVPRQYVDMAQETELNYLLILKAPQQTAIDYYVSFCADKEKDGYHSAADWFGAVGKWKEALDNPVSVKIKE